MEKRTDVCVVCGAPCDYVLNSDAHSVKTTSCCEKHFDAVWTDMIESVLIGDLSLFEEKYHKKDE